MNDQLKINGSILKIINYIKPKYVFVDQLRFNVATVLASICKNKKIGVILIPHGSISKPDSKYSEFVLPICARGLVYSKLASYSVAQSKILIWGNTILWLEFKNFKIKTIIIW